MEISQYILDEATDLLAKPNIKALLPMQLPSAPSFFLAEPNDKTVLAFGTVSFLGENYKIGALVSE